MLMNEQRGVDGMSRQNLVAKHHIQKSNYEVNSQKGISRTEKDAHSARKMVKDRQMENERAVKRRQEENERSKKILIGLKKEDTSTHIEKVEDGNFKAK